MTNLSISYSRAPSEALRDFLMPDQSQGPLLELDGQVRGGYECSVHFRRDDEVHVYRGLTRVITAKWLKSGGLKVPADNRNSYAEQLREGGLYGKWHTLGPDFKDLLDRYLDGLEVSRRQTAKEGTVQMLWSRVQDPWVPFDREAELSYQSKPHRKEATDFPEVNDALAKLENVYEAHRGESGPNRWKEPPKSGRKLDQLAVDSEGRLVLLELKDGLGGNAGVYYSPFQLLRYVWEWLSAWEEVRDDLRELIEARKYLGLMPRSTPVLAEGIRAAVGFGHATPGGRTKERYGMVLEIVNRHLPPEVAPIETWKHSDVGPHCLC